MEQLKMYRLSGNAPSEVELPEGYGLSRYRGPEDKMPWIYCCRNQLVSDDAGEAVFDQCILNHADVDPFNDVFFLDHGSEHIGTATAILHPEGNWGELHMVGIRADHRGLGLSKFLNHAALRKLLAQNVRYVMLTTDEWRRSAIRSYLSAGFLPVDYDVDMPKRWQSVLQDLEIPRVDMLDEDGNFVRTLENQKMHR